jgi:hypothetical protein
MERTSPHIEQAEAALAERIACTRHWDESCERAAAVLGEALVASGMPHGGKIRRLRGAGLSRRAARGVLRDARRAARDRELAEYNEQFVDSTPVCPHCIAPLGPHDHFCPKCKGPVTPHAAIDPLGQVYFAGRAYRRAVSSPPSSAVIVGMWLIFAPAALYMLYCVGLVLLAAGAFGPQDYLEGDGLPADLLKLLLVCGLFAVYSAILWKMTARWAKSRRAE